MSAVVVMKIGGSVLGGPQAFRRAAAFLAARLCARPEERIVAVVSAETGVTDALLATAQGIVENPDAATLDLLWSTGEVRSAALLALALQALGVNAGAANVHQTGLLQTGSQGPKVPGLPPDLGTLGPSDRRTLGPSDPRTLEVRPLRLRALLTQHDVLVAPGFLARGCGDTVVSLGRGGSDLTAVLLAAGLGAERCELLKDVPGYFTADPKREPSARPLETLSYAGALEMAEAGCQLVQRQALETARDRGVRLVVGAIGHVPHTVIH